MAWLSEAGMTRRRGSGDGGAHSFGAISPFRSPARKGGFIANYCHWLVPARMRSQGCHSTLPAHRALDRRVRQTAYDEDNPYALAQVPFLGVAIVDCGGCRTKTAGRPLRFRMQRNAVR